MGGILLFSHSGFSDTNANGITMKNLLAAFSAEETAEFYCDVSSPDFTAAHHYFRITDVQMLKAFFFKKPKCIFEYSAEKTEKTQASRKNAKKIPAFMKKQKYNFGIKWLREILWRISPWGHKKLRSWIEARDPEAIVYMVGESIFMDKLVLKTCQKLKKPLVLYHCEAYRIIDLSQRKGIERAYYRKTHKLYSKLNEAASLIIYNSQMLQEAYEKRYPKKAETMLSYNSAAADYAPYVPQKPLKITYFGNLGVGRSESLVQAAQILKKIDSAQVLDIYGNADAQTQALFAQCDNICCHGFLEAEQLRSVIERSDLLLHVESFEPQIAQKLRYAFSTKIAQCLCAGRCFVSYAPPQTASTLYLQAVGAPVATSAAELETLLRRVLTDEALRSSYASEARSIGLKNHCKENSAQQVRQEIGAILNEV